MFTLRSSVFFLCAALCVFAVGAHAQQNPADALGLPPETTDVTPVAPASSDPEIDQLLKKIEGDPVAQQAVPVAPAPADMPVPVEDGATPTPGQDVLMPVPSASDTPPIGAETEVMAVPALPPAAEDADENLFFDSDSLAPQGEMKNAAPRKVDPVKEPASKLIVVKKNFEAGSPQALLVSAQRAVALGRYDSALRLYDELYAKNKRDPNILLGRAVALQKSGQKEEAIQAYQTLLDLKPDNKEAQINMLGLMAERYPAVALQRLKVLSQRNPQDAGLIAQVAVVEANLGHYNEALEALGMASGMDPNNASHLYNMAIIADRAGKKNEAIDYYEKALEIDTIYGGGRSIPREAALARLAQLR